MQSYFVLLLLWVVLSVTRAADLSLQSHKELLQDERVIAIKFYSAMCGSCKEFEPEWDAAVDKLKSVVTAKVNIDSAEGIKIAQATPGVLDGGIPSVVLYASKSKPIIVVKGDVQKSKQVVAAIRKHVANLARRDDGFFIKTN